MKVARTAKKLTQKQLAVLIGAKHNSISNWENNQNKPDVSYIELMAGVLEVEPSYFFDAKEEKRVLEIFELMHINKYNFLDEHGKQVVDSVLQLEYDRCKKLAEIN